MTEFYQQYLSFLATKLQHKFKNDEISQYLSHCLITICRHNDYSLHFFRLLSDTAELFMWVYQLLLPTSDDPNVIPTPLAKFYVRRCEEYIHIYFPAYFESALYKFCLQCIKIPERRFQLFEVMIEIHHMHSDPA